MIKPSFLTLLPAPTYPPFIWSFPDDPLDHRVGPGCDFPITSGPNPGQNRAAVEEYTGNLVCSGMKAVRNDRVRTIFSSWTRGVRTLTELQKAPALVICPCSFKGLQRSQRRLSGFCEAVNIKKRLGITEGTLFVTFRLSFYETFRKD